MSVRVEIGNAPIDPGKALSSLASPADGAVNLFLGVVRDHHQSRRVLRLRSMCEIIAANAARGAA